MSSRVRDDSSSSEAGIPPTLDLVRHFRELRSVLIPALVIAVLCAGGVYAWRAQTPARWEATVTARADSPVSSAASSAASADATSTSLLTAPYLALGGDPAVLQRIASAAGVGWSADAAQSRITVTDGQTPGLLRIQVLGDSAAQAAAVAKQAVPTLDSAARTHAGEATAAPIQQLQTTANALSDQMLALPVTVNDTKRAALQTQYQAQLDQISRLQGAVTSRLAALADPVTSAGPVSPRPLRDAVLALLAALIIAAELMVALRGRWGRAVSRSWSIRTARKHGATLVDCSRDRGIPAAGRVETLVLRRLRAGADVLVLYCPSLEGTVLSAVGTAALSGDAGGSARGTLVQLSAAEAWWRSAALETAGLGVVVVKHRAGARQPVRRRLLALADAGIPAVLMLVGRGWVPADDSAALAPGSSTEVAEPVHGEPVPTRSAEPESAEAAEPELDLADEPQTDADLTSDHEVEVERQPEPEREPVAMTLVKGDAKSPGLLNRLGRGRTPARVASGAAAEADVDPEHAQAATESDVKSVAPAGSGSETDAPEPEPSASPEAVQTDDRPMETAGWVILR